MNKVALGKYLDRVNNHCKIKIWSVFSRVNHTDISLQLESTITCFQFLLSSYSDHEKVVKYPD